MYMYNFSLFIPCLYQFSDFNVYLYNLVIILYLTANGLSPGGSGYNACK